MTLAQLEEKTCANFGGSNCVLHGCMFTCALNDAIKAAAQNEGKTPSIPKKN